MNLKSGLPFSLVKNGLVASYPKLSKNIRADVVVIGGGICGALTGWHLAKENVDTVLIDGRTIGLGSTCASSSLLLYELDTPLHQLEEQIGKEAARLSYRYSLEAIDRLKQISKQLKFTDLQEKESIFYAARKGHIRSLKKEFEARKKLGIDVRFLEGNNVIEETGFHAPAVIISAKAAQTDAYMFTHALHQDSIKNGLKIYDRTSATEIAHHKTGVNIQTAEGFRIHAKKLVYATGYETVNYIDRSITKIRSTFATISESYSAEQVFWPKERLIWNTADPYLYIRTTPDRRVMVGGRDENFYSPRKRNKLIGPKTRLLVRDLKKVFPDLGFLPEFSWTGAFAFTKDGLPYIGSYKKLPNSYFALGFGGNGISFSQVAAEIITDLIMGRKNKQPAFFSFDR